ncbi:MAG: hypothetical protein K2J08_02090 [Ruminococcus sp.]|nr:hypothetical protein [Ruminococcus sp.]
MKKYLLVICVLLTFTAFASCGDSNSSIAETPEVSESVVLDSVFENDYLKISVNSDWEESTDNIGHENYIDWKWENEDFSSHGIRLTFTEDDSGKVSLEDFISAYENNDGYMPLSKHMSDFNFEKDKLIDTFEHNNQAYALTGNIETHRIFFKTDAISGNFTYSVNDEVTIMDMIESIEFKKLEIETTTSKKEKTTKATTKKYIPIKTVTKASKPVTEPPTEKVPETQPPVIETVPVQIALHFVLNLDTNCIHINPECSAALKILPENYSTIDITEDNLGNYNGTYWACGKCCPNNYRQLLPKF